MTNLRQYPSFLFGLFFILLSAQVLAADLPANQFQLKTILSTLSKNPIINAAVKQATDAGEKCKYPIISATKPPQFEDGTTFDFTDTIDCVGVGGENNGLVVRTITVIGRYFGPAAVDPLTIKITRAG